MGEKQFKKEPDWPGVIQEVKIEFHPHTVNKPDYLFAMIALHKLNRHDEWKKIGRWKKDFEK